MTRLEQTLQGMEGFIAYPLVGKLQGGGGLEMWIFVIHNY